MKSLATRFVLYGLALTTMYACIEAIFQQAGNHFAPRTFPVDEDDFLESSTVVLFDW